MWEKRIPQFFFPLKICPILFYLFISKREFSKKYSSFAFEVAECKKLLKAKDFFLKRHSY
jgi:hypothetical protein